ncbi:hypothetical protein [Pseudophaeobacter sp.]|uniref:hypothetical protein n=1 Tax=Pseudophaeobacter sp. TaxID=1971739 RepID=UPI00329A3D2C
MVFNPAPRQTNTIGEAGANQTAKARALITVELVETKPVSKGWMKPARISAAKAASRCFVLPKTIVSQSDWLGRKPNLKELFAFKSLGEAKQTGKPCHRMLSAKCY